MIAFNYMKRINGDIPNDDDNNQGSSGDIDDGEGSGSGNTGGGSDNTGGSSNDSNLIIVPSNDIVCVYYRMGATVTSEGLSMFEKENDTTYTNIDRSNLKLVYYSAENPGYFWDHRYEEYIELTNHWAFVDFNEYNGPDMEIKGRIMQFHEGFDITEFIWNDNEYFSCPFTEGGDAYIYPLYSNYEIKWDDININEGDAIGAIGKYTYIKDQNKWIKVDNDQTLNGSYYLKFYRVHDPILNDTIASLILYNNEQPLFALYSNPVTDKYDNEYETIIYPMIIPVSVEGKKMNGLKFSYNPNDDYEELVPIYDNIKYIFTDPYEDANCPTLHFENVEVTYKN